MESLPASSVIVNTENLAGHKGISQLNSLLKLAHKHQIWDYNHRNISILANYGIKDVRFLVFGYQRELDTIDLKPVVDCKYDVLFYGSSNPRREKVFSDLEQRGVKIKKIWMSFGKERDSLVADSKIVLNLHYYESMMFEIVRVHYLVNNGVAVIAEINEETSIHPLYRRVVEGVCYERLADTCIQFLRQPEKIEHLRLESKLSFQETPQTESLRALLRK